MNPLEALQHYFGYDSFRSGQEPVIRAICAGRDVLGVMPTGAGKSLCYQIPAVVLGGMTLVISPLISLMKDQVGALNQVGIRACYLNSSLTPRQYRLALQYASEGRYRIAYVAPERLLTPDFLAFAQSAPIRLICVDEAHCISQWGHDFRPAYLAIQRFVQALPVRPPVAAFTATATERVRDDMIRLLSLRNPMIKITGFDRSNLRFAVLTPTDKYRALRMQLEHHPEESGIIYCATRKTVEEVTARLQEDGFQATRYHAGLTDAERTVNQDDFLYDRKRIMVATNAFGMGIDKSNVRFVIHYQMPKNLESYYQEAGRAGRDGLPGDCVLLFSERDVSLGRYLIEHTQEDGEPRAPEIVAAERNLLMKMADYCRTTDCLRAYILRYFGETAPDVCNHCSNCQGDFVDQDVTGEARRILGCISATRERYGAGMIAEILCGIRSERVTASITSQTDDFGALSHWNLDQLHAFIDHLCVRGCLRREADGLPVLCLTSFGRDVLNGHARVTMRMSRTTPAPTVSATSAKGNLFDVLRTLRQEKAKREFVPPYVVFSDQTLMQMCEKRPQTEEAMRQISGVGEAKLKKYGRLFLEAIRKYTEKESADRKKTVN